MPQSMPQGYAETVASQPVSQDEMYATLIQEERVKNLIQQVSPQSQLHDIRMLIRGYYRNESKGIWEKIDPQSEEPNGLMVSRFISYLGSILNHNTTLGNLSETQINRIMGLVINYISDDLEANAEIYALGTFHEYKYLDDRIKKDVIIKKFVPNYTEWTRIGHIMLNSVFMVLCRALNGAEARRMWGSIAMNESLSPQQSKGGITDFLRKLTP